MSKTASGGPQFDSYTDTYKEIINRSARLSGEQYEYFAELRLKLMQRELAAATGRFDGFSLLDFGCGIGDTARIMSGIFPGSELTGIDESGESIARAASLGLPNTTFITAGEDLLPLADEAFDAAYSNGTFHHIPWDRQISLLKELSRAMKQQGLLFIFENNPLNPLMMRAMRMNPFDAGLTAVPPARLIALGKEVGLSPVKTRYYFFFPRILKAMRPLEKLLGSVPFGAQYYVMFRKDRP
jgi:ubiquinone/menaquinone biosynthesis C-methylase UbiE